MLVIIRWQAYKVSVNNIKNYIRLLGNEGKICFAPHVSMVINKNTADDVIPFLKFALEIKASYVTYFFDYRENNMEEDYFQDSETYRRVLKQLMEIEKVLKSHFSVFFRLWTPMKEVEMMERTIESQSIEELEERYTDIIKLASNRSVVDENRERNKIRKKAGKKELTLDEDLTFTLQTHVVGDKNVCKAAWKLLDIYPNGRMDFCSWHLPTLFLPDFIKNDSVNWDEVINSKEFCTYRCNMLDDNYIGCMKCCPIIRDVQYR